HFGRTLGRFAALGLGLLLLGRFHVQFDFLGDERIVAAFAAGHVAQFQAHVAVGGRLGFQFVERYVMLLAVVLNDLHVAVAGLVERDNAHAAVGLVVGAALGRSFLRVGR